MFTRIILATGLISSFAFGQTFPSRIASNSDLLVASNNATSTLSVSLSPTDTSINVANGSQFVANAVINIDQEQIKICSIAGSTFTVCSGGRGFAGSTAASHQLGAVVANYVNAIYHNTMSAEVQSIESFIATGYGGALYKFGSTISSSADAGISRTSAGVLKVGNGTAGDGSGTIQAGTVIGVNVNGTFTGNGACITAQGVIYAGCFGVAASNANNVPNLQAAFNAAYNPSLPGQATPMVVQLPPGTLKLCSQLQLPSLVTVRGTGRGDPSSLIAPSGNATVLQAASGCWAGGTTLGTNNSVVLQGGFGATSTEYFNSKLLNVAIDGNNQAGGLFRANCQEQCGTEGVIMTNLKYYGFADWGANNNGNDGPTNAPFGLPAGFQGSANDGPDVNMEIYPYSGADHNFHPIWLMNIAGYRGINGLTIATDNPSQSGGAFTPDNSGTVWGDNISLSGMHSEGPRTGWLIGPFSLGNGASNVIASNNQFATPGIVDTGCTFDLQVPKGFTALATEIGAGMGHRVCNESNSTTDDSSSYLFDIRQSNNDHLFFSLLGGISMDAPIATTSDITSGGKLQGFNDKIQSTAPCRVTQYAESTPFIFPGQTSCVDTNGDLTWTFSGEITPGGGNKILGDQYYQGAQTIAMGIGRNKAGLNMSAPENVGGHVMTVIGSNLSWNDQTGDYFVSNNGQPDASGIITYYDGVHVATNNAVTSNSHYTAAAVQGWYSANFNIDGTSSFGRTNVTGAVATFTDSAGVCTVDPSSGGFYCSSDRKLKKNLNYKAMNSALSKIMLLKPLTYNWEKEENGSGVHPGFIAQDVQKVLPGLVHTDQSGNLQLNQMELIPYLVQAIKAEQAEIVELKKQVKALSLKR